MSLKSLIIIIILMAIGALYVSTYHYEFAINYGIPFVVIFVFVMGVNAVRNDKRNREIRNDQHLKATNKFLDEAEYDNDFSKVPAGEFTEFPQSIDPDFEEDQKHLLEDLDVMKYHPHDRRRKRNQDS